ncbi:MAG: hypothetical protein WCF65_06665 [Parachlamydiaceae bacterium]
MPSTRQTPVVLNALAGAHKGTHVLVKMVRPRGWHHAVMSALAGAHKGTHVLAKMVRPRGWHPVVMSALAGAHKGNPVLAPIKTSKQIQQTAVHGIILAGLSVLSTSI